jgi:hypothetical protein
LISGHLFDDKNPEQERNRNYPFEVLGGPNFYKDVMSLMDSWEPELLLEWLI